MTGSLVLPDPPLVPSGAEGRSLLRHELLRPEYHDRNIVQRVLDWLDRGATHGLDRASQTPTLSTATAMVLFLLLLGGLAWLVSRLRLRARAEEDAGPVLTGEAVTARELRARADEALAEGRHEDAVADGFRALVLHQVEAGRIDDAPGATAHEVSLAVATAHPGHQADVMASGLLFDVVRYGDGSATREQAASVLALDDDLAGVRR